MARDHRSSPEDRRESAGRLVDHRRLHRCHRTQLRPGTVGTRTNRGETVVASSSWALGRVRSCRFAVPVLWILGAFGSSQRVTWVDVRIRQRDASSELLDATVESSRGGAASTEASHRVDHECRRTCDHPLACELSVPERGSTA